MKRFNKKRIRDAGKKLEYTATVHLLGNTACIVRGASREEVSAEAAKVLHMYKRVVLSAIKTCGQ